MVKTVVADYHAQIFMWPHGTTGDLRFKALLAAADPEGPFCKAAGLSPANCENNRIGVQFMFVPEIEEDMWCAVAEAHLQNIDQLMDAEKWPATIAESTKGINLVEEKIVSNSAWSAALGPYLSRLYGCRGIAYCEKGSNAPALQDIEKALAMPAAYRKSEVDTGLRFYKARLEKALQPGAAPRPVVGQDVVIAVGLAETSYHEAAYALQSNNPFEAITKATKGIQTIEDIAAKNPSLSPVTGSFLFQLHYCRAVAYAANGSNSEALRDIETAIAMPAAYHNAEMDEQLPGLKVQIEELIKKSKCFIATAAYGSALAPEVATLRQFRDARLKPHRMGQLFVRLYERLSPPLANWIAARKTARVWVQRLVLTPLVWVAKRWTD
jgi:tetratricopeptide (TPR) repeat protein